MVDVFFCFSFPLNFSYIHALSRPLASFDFVFISLIMQDLRCLGSNQLVVFSMWLM